MRGDNPATRDVAGDRLERLRRVTRGKLLRWAVRCVLTATLFAVLLPRYPALVWALCFLVLLELLNLALIMVLHLKLRRLATLLALHPELASEE